MLLVFNTIRMCNFMFEMSVTGVQNVHHHQSKNVYSYCVLNIMGTNCHDLRKGCF